MSRSRNGAALPAAVLLLGLAAGCGEPEQPPPDGPTTSSPESPDEGTASATAPAGVELEVGSASVVLPEDWTPDRNNTQKSQDAELRGGLSDVSLYDLGEVGPVTLQQLTPVILRNAGFERPRTTKAELGGAPAILVVDKVADPTLAEQQYAAVEDGTAVMLRFSFDPEEFSPAEQEVFVEDVLASYEWR